MKYLSLFAFLLLNVTSNAQYVSPIDSIPKAKKQELLKFGENMSMEILSNKVFKLFREVFDGPQKTTRAGFYKIPNMDSGGVIRSTFLIPIEVINSLNKKEFAEHLLTIYADSLSENKLLLLNQAFKTKDGIKFKEFMRKIVSDEPDETDYTVTGLFDDIDNYNIFSSITKIIDYIDDNIMLILFSYIKEKSITYD